MALLNFFQKPFFWVIVAITAAFIAVPLWHNDVALRESLVLASVYIILASNLNLMIGYAGCVNFGSIVFFGLGGYIGVFLITGYGWPLALAALAAGVVVSALALLLGLGILRLQGFYFALATIGVNQAVLSFVSNFTPWGGASGIYISMSSFQALGGPMKALWTIYFLLVAVMAASLLLSYGIKTSKFGLGLLAVGQNESAAAVLGVPTPLYKALAYSVSAYLPAVAGCLYFFKSAFIQPVDAFDLSFSTEAVVMVMLGGQSTVAGPAIGAFLYEELRGWLLTSATFSDFQLVIAGALLLLIVTFAPGGVMGFIRRYIPKSRKFLE
jgi:branched-chain amino acid transport system permease protein